MLELAVKSLGEFDPFEDDHSCKTNVAEMCLCTDLSARTIWTTVASYLMDFEDHFTSHSYLPNVILPSKPPTPRNLLNKPNEDRNILYNSEAAPQNVDDSEDSDSEDGDQENEDSPYLNTLLEPDGGIDADLATENEEVGVPQINWPIIRNEGAELYNVCVWDFLSRIDKVSKTSDRRKHTNNEDNNAAESPEDLNPSDTTETILDDAAKECDQDTEETVTPVMDIEGLKRPRVILKKGHGQEKNSHPSSPGSK
ncbi:hypothetical protein B0H14DRAFT_2644599 [Mycena olivaceomarginata]|nr:hypothetical protein B0H14DRAFT_2644599 [Mycena olivaceomarginata]